MQIKKSLPSLTLRFSCNFIYWKYSHWWLKAKSSAKFVWYTKIKLMRENNLQPVVITNYTLFKEFSPLSYMLVLKLLLLLMFFIVWHVCEIKGVKIFLMLTPEKNYVQCIEWIFNLKKLHWVLFCGCFKLKMINEAIKKESCVCARWCKTIQLIDCRMSKSTLLSPCTCRFSCRSSFLREHAYMKCNKNM